ncbi:MAG: GatB/YqeY domain-containing protein, partial [Flavobacteriales bacterium]|nr:GatB/YqeY domain-containing protein [Flavobacteriales bacterium]
KQLSKDAVEKVIDMIILDLGTCSSADMGKVMGLAINKLRGQADGKLISTLVKGKLK